MQQLNFVKGRRLRIFAGPNGSGKSTIFEKINSKFDLGYYINPDLIEKEIQESHEVNIADFGLSPSSETFLQFINDHSLKTKAEQKGFRLNLSLKGNKIQISQHHQLSYEAALDCRFFKVFLNRKG